jgi:RimJ/RimL family protein N-acetyltransferase
MIELRPMTGADLPLVQAWLREPHVARWWLADETAEATLDEYVERMAGRGDTATTMLLVVEPGRGPVGWAQWYRWGAYPEEARELRTGPDEVGLDYAIGDPAAIGRGLGAEMIAALVDEVHAHHPGCGLVVEPEAANLASCRVLERNGFALVDVRPLDFEPGDRPMAVYRLPGDE